MFCDLKTSYLLCQYNLRMSDQYSVWDELVASKDCDLDKLQKDMLDKLNAEPDNVDILWRVARLLYRKSLEVKTDVEIKAGTLDSLKYLEKAAQLSPDNFDVNKWLANVYGRMALLETDVDTRIK